MTNDPEPIKRKRGRPEGTNKEGLRRELTMEEQDALFLAAHRRGIREEFMLVLTYRLALRVKELVELKLDDFKDETKEVLVKGCKGGDRQHYKVPGLWPLYEKWLKERAKTTPESNRWLLPHRDKPDDHLTTGGGKCVFYNAARDAGITGHSIHDLRHSCAQDLANSGAPQVTIAGWLRHQSVDSAERYVSTRLSAELQRTLDEQFSRRGKKRWVRR
jgi:integrase